jgi:predicted RNA-binding protein associated with RNAse of E/G family
VLIREEVIAAMEVSAIKRAVLDAVNRGQISRLEAEEALRRIERAEEAQTRVENDPNATDAQKTHALDEFNAASEEAADLLNRL